MAWWSVLPGADQSGMSSANKERNSMCLKEYIMYQSIDVCMMKIYFVLFSVWNLRLPICEAGKQRGEDIDPDIGTEPYK